MTKPKEKIFDNPLKIRLMYDKSLVRNRSFTENPCKGRESNYHFLELRYLVM